MLRNCPCSKICVCILVTVNAFLSICVNVYNASMLNMTHI